MKYQKLAIKVNQGKGVIFIVMFAFSEAIKCLELAVEIYTDMVSISLYIKFFITVIIEQLVQVRFWVRNQENRQYIKGKSGQS